MPIFIAAQCAILDNQTIQYAGLLKSDSLEGAKKMVSLKIEQDHPVSVGWKHGVVVNEVSKETLLKMLEYAR